MGERIPDDEYQAEPANLRFLRRLVTLLTAVMIGGLVAVIALLVIRLQAPVPVLPVLPEAIALPDGITPEAITFGTGWIAVVAGDRILIFDAESGAIRQDVSIK
ncbi:MAG: DUF6476 family protein [Pseudomonadota bacterium]